MIAVPKVLDGECNMFCTLSVQNAFGGQQYLLINQEFCATSSWTISAEETDKWILQFKNAVLALSNHNISEESIQ